MKQNFVEDNIKILSVSPENSSNDFSFATNIFGINSGHGFIVGSTLGGRQIVVDLAVDTLFSLECTSTFINGIPDDCSVAVFTYVAPSSRLNANIKTDYSMMCPIQHLSNNSLTYGGRFVIPKLFVPAGQNQYVAFGLFNASTNPATHSFSMRAHVEDVQVFDPLR